MKFPGVVNEPCFLSAYLAFQTTIEHWMLTPKPDTETGYQACAARVYVPSWWIENSIDACATVVGSRRDGIYFCSDHVEEAFPATGGLIHANIYDALVYHSFECQGRHSKCRDRNAAYNHPAREEIVKHYEERAKAAKAKKNARDELFFSSFYRRIRERDDVGPDGIREFYLAPKGSPDFDNTGNPNVLPPPPYPTIHARPASKLNTQARASIVSNGLVQLRNLFIPQPNNHEVQYEETQNKADDEKMPSPNPEMLRIMSEWGGSSSSACESVHSSGEDERMPSPNPEMLRIMSEWGGSDSSDCDGECEISEERPDER
ncbi:hypothetical protein DFH06DRAFT_1129744 [Mycena polygramma]|nr:hypothetical protein DFH06DRAFT_1129744 [Mycena polygramma]